jgi:hypothetical protein
MSLLLKMLLEPPVSYVFALLVGFFIGGGVQLIDMGISGFLITRTIKELKINKIIFLSIASLILGAMLTITGLALLCVLIFNIFIGNAHILSLIIDAIFVVITLQAVGAQYREDIGDHHQRVYAL